MLTYREALKLVRPTSVRPDYTVRCPWCSRTLSLTGPERTPANILKLRADMAQHIRMHRGGK